MAVSAYAWRKFCEQLISSVFWHGGGSATENKIVNIVDDIFVVLRQEITGTQVKVSMLVYLGSTDCFV